MFKPIACEAKVELRAWPLRTPFVIARSSRTHVDIIQIELSDGINVGRGECQPNTRYNEDPEKVTRLLKDITQTPVGTDAVAELAKQSRAAANALDCALWDLHAKRAGMRAWQLADMTVKDQLQSVFTISLGASELMAKQAKEAFTLGKQHLKLKLGTEGDKARMIAVRKAVPDAKLVIDANEGWAESELRELLAVAAGEGIEMVEQPLPAGKDQLLGEFDHKVPVCADESFKDIDDLRNISDRYEMVNIKLDKTGGLTTAIQVVNEAERCGMEIMVGCMLCTSLGAAASYMLASQARFIDLDGPMLLADDMTVSLEISETGGIAKPLGALWG